MFLRFTSWFGNRISERGSRGVFLRILAFFALIAPVLFIGTYTYFHIRQNLIIGCLAITAAAIFAWLMLITFVDRRRAEEALSSSEERFRAVMETANDAIVSAASDGNIIQFNKAAERIFGYAADEAVGKPLTLLMPFKFHEAHRSGFARFLSTGVAHVVGKTVELAGRRKDGSEFPLELSLASWKIGDKVFFTGILRDITERKQAEETSAKLNRGLADANKELEAFSYSVSHDLRAPLRAIDGFSKIIEEEYSSKFDLEGMRLLKVVRNNTRKMGELIDDLLAFSRLGRKELEKTDIDMAAIAGRVVAEQKFLAPERKIDVQIGKMPMGYCDSVLIQQVWVNLISNAFKFTRDNPNARVEIGGEFEAEEDVFWVKDNGVGFDMQYADKLFGVFQRLHRADEFEGTGVGLAIVQRIIHRHGGRVRADAKLNEGAAFYFTLPAKKEDV